MWTPPVALVSVAVLPAAPAQRCLETDPNGFSLQTAACFLLHSSASDVQPINRCIYTQKKVVWIWKPDCDLKHVSLMETIFHVLYFIVGLHLMIVSLWIILTQICFIHKATENSEKNAHHCSLKPKFGPSKFPKPRLSLLHQQFITICLWLFVVINNSYLLLLFHITLHKVEYLELLTVNKHFCY